VLNTKGIVLLHSSKRIAINTRQRWGSTLLLACFLIFALPALASASAKTSRTVQSFGPLSVGGEIPAFALPHPEQGLVSKRTLLQSGQPLLISFWADWCRACKRGMDEVDSWVKRLESAQKTPPTLLFINLKDSPETTARALADHQWDLPVAHDRFGSVGERFGLTAGTSLPLTLLLDADGTIRTIFLSEGEDYIDVLEKEWRRSLAATRSAKADITPQPTVQ
jgi:peroxiredoxin